MDRIRKAFVRALHLNVSGEDLAYEDKLDTAAGLDSIALLEFVTAVEDDFGIQIEPHLLAFDFLRDLPRLAAYLEERTARRSAT